MKIMRSILATAFLLSCFLSQATGLALAGPSQPSASDPLVGYSGRIEFIPNKQRKEMTVVLRMTGGQGSSTHQIVFHLQDPTESMPQSWNGSGRLLANSSVVAVLPVDGKPGWLFKFSDVPLPPSLSPYKFQVFTTYGIARYGETKPLTARQIHSLAITGSPNPSSAS
jgi:hypothetical protein